jgi:hypothetical protein
MDSKFYPDTMTEETHLKDLGSAGRVTLNIYLKKNGCDCAHWIKLAGVLWLDICKHRNEYWASAQRR